MRVARCPQQAPMLRASAHPISSQHSRIRCSAAAKVRQRSRQAHCAATPGFAPPKEAGSIKKQAQKEKAAVEDKLIAAFQSKPKGEWRKLLAFSKRWPSLADGVFKRVEHNISEEQDPEIKLKLRRFQKGLKAAHDSVARARDVFAMFLSAKEADHESLVAGNFSELTGEFFEYIQHKVGASAAAADAAKAKWSAEELKESADEREHWVSLGTRIAALASSFEKAQQDDDALAGAAERFQDLLQVGSMKEAETRIDKMAAEGTLDPAFLLTMAKAYSGVKESEHTKDDVKEIMYHLYMKAKDATARQAPPEVRILKYLLSLDDPVYRRAEMEKSFEKGPELETQTADLLCTEPQKLMLTVDTVLQAYESQRGNASMLGQTADLMQPSVIKTLRELRDDLHKRFF